MNRRTSLEPTDGPTAIELGAAERAFAGGATDGQPSLTDDSDAGAT